MSIQNRWTSFDDPNRWIIRFRDDLNIYRARPWQLDEDLPYPNYWTTLTTCSTGSSGR